MKKLTRTEIDERLEALRKTKDAEENNYFHTANLHAMCYVTISPFMTGEKSITRTCCTCGNEFIVGKYTLDEFNIKHYEDIVKRFENAGMQAEIKYFCDTCKDCPTSIIYLKTQDETDWHISYPRYEDSDLNKFYDCTDLSDYETVLKFLTQAILPEKLSYSQLFNEIYTYQGFIKSNVHSALKKVLGINILYDKSEIKRMLEAYISNNFSSLEKQWLLDNMTKILDKSEKETFTEKNLNHFIDLLRKKEYELYKKKYGESDLLC